MSITANPQTADVLAALQAWWQTQPTLQQLTSDGRLWHLQASEDVDLPYCTYFLVSQQVETFTTGYPLIRTSIQINCHADTDYAAQQLAANIAAATKNAPLVIRGGSPMHVLPDSFGIEIGGGLGTKGRDCWLAFFTVDIPWTN